MNKKIKLSLLGTLIAGSALAVTLPIVSCSASTDVVLTGTVSTNAGAAYIAYVKKGADVTAQQKLVDEGHIVPAGVDFDALVAAITFKDDADADAVVAAVDVIESFVVKTGVKMTSAGVFPSGVVLTVNLKSGYSSVNAIEITVGAATKA